MARRSFLVLIATATSVACHETPPEPPAVLARSALEVVAAQAVEGGLPGISIAVRQPDGVLLTAAAGLADRAANTPMTPATLVHAASTTKAVTAAAVLRLVDSGVLSLEARLPDLLPAAILENVPHVAAIDVRALLRHTSGLYSPNNDPIYLARYIGPERLEKPFWRPEEIVAFAADPANAPAFAPGEGQRYGDINYVLLGLIVEHVAGEPFKVFVTREIFDPLGLDATYFLSDHPSQPRARGYTVDSDIVRSIGLDATLLADDAGLVDTTDAQEQSDAAAGLISTMTDLARFAHAMTKGDLLSEDSRAFLLEVADRAPASGEEALGVLRAYATPRGVLVTAEGDGPGTHVTWALHRPSGTIVAVAVNLFGRWDESEVLLHQVIPAVLDAVP